MLKEVMNDVGRQLSEEFMHDLKEGILKPLLERIQKDYTLMFTIRKEYINVYYRGGNLMKLSRNKNGDYKVEFDKKYLEFKDKVLSDEIINDLKSFIKDRASVSNKADIQQWIDKFPALKQAMDLKFADKGSDEREFQQLIFRENNASRLSNDTEYFFSDIEYSPEGNRGANKKQYRFDMLGVEWLASKRKYGNSCRPVIMEIKYGDNAFGGKSGIADHLNDIIDFLSSKKSEFIAQINSQMSQLRDLGLVKLTEKNGHKIEIQPDAKPIVVFVFANTNSRSGKLANMIKEVESEIKDQEHMFDVRFFVASFCGYAMHHERMLDIQQFKQVLKIVDEEQS